MLQNHTILYQEKQMKTYGFLIALEAEEGVDLESARLAFCDANRFREGVGKVEVEMLGEISCYENTEEAG